MKPLSSFLCAMAFLTAASHAAPHHAVTFTGAVYADSTTPKITTTIINNLALIEHFTSVTTPRAAAAYDVVLNDSTSEVDVIQKILLAIKGIVLTEAKAPVSLPTARLPEPSNRVPSHSILTPLLPTLDLFTSSIGTTPATS